MRLRAAASHFDRMVCNDAYSGAQVFRAQLGLYDDNRRDSETAQRRVLSVASGVTLPARRVVAAAGTRFILGHANPDYSHQSIVRVGYVVHEATELAQVRSLAQVCLNQPGFTAWAGRSWVKNLAYSEQSSRLVPQYHIHFAANEPVATQSIVTFGSRLHVVRAVEPGQGGTLVCTSDELPEPAVEMATVTNSTYDPVNDTFTGTPQAVRVLRVRWQSLFQYRNQVAPKFESDEMQVVVAKSVMTVNVGALFELSDGDWKVSSVQSEGDVWLCRVTQHG